MNEHLRRAMEALETGTADLRRMSTGPAYTVRRRIEQTVDEVLQHLEADADDPAPEDVVSRLDRQSREIAEDLRRVERLMKRRTGIE